MESEEEEKREEQKEEHEEKFHSSESQKQYKKAVRDKKFVERQAKADLVFVLGTIQGRRFLSNLIDFCKPLDQSYYPETNCTYFVGGQRYIGAKIMNDINNAAPKSLALMTEEKNREKGNKDNAGN